MTPPVLNLRDAPLSRIAAIIQRDWKEPYFGAVPYIEAMHALGDIDDAYGVESGHDIVAYFLANALTWRGETARAVKKELKRRCRWTS